MPEIKAIITDLDRTLLRNDKSISDHSVSVFRKCAERGIFLAVATARPMRSIKEYTEKIPFNAAAVLNGAEIHCGSRIITEAIESRSAETVLEKLCKISDIKISAEIGGVLYANFDLTNIFPMSVIYKSFPELPSKAPVHKILVSSESHEIYETVKECLSEDLYCTVANGQLIQIMSKKASKLNAVKIILSENKILPSEAAYFGDDNDDTEALAFCGMGVAMKNAVDASKKAADHIADSNENDGAAKFIEEKILGECGS